MELSCGMTLEILLVLKLNAFGSFKGNVGLALYSIIRFRSVKGSRIQQERICEVVVYKPAMTKKNSELPHNQYLTFTNIENLPQR